MANTSIELVDLDFQTVKNNLITYLRSQARFKDIDFTASNINVLIDLLAYNTYQQAFYLNMVASEMFLDSAQLRSSVVSHAKELNYLPRSFRSAKAIIDLAVTPNTSISSLTIPKGTSFTSTVGANTFTFTVPVNKIITQAESNGQFIVDNLEVYEGVFQKDSFVVDNSNTEQRFILTSPTIDTESITVTVVEDSGDTVLDYNVGTSLFGITVDSKVCFVQATDNNLYEIVFGNNIASRKPKDGAVVVVEYRTCSGELPNGATTFIINESISGQSNISISTVESATGGAISETLNDIKFNAPRYFQTQERAVTSSDYMVLLRRQFPEIQAINAYGGEDADPPQYGKVIISVDVESADAASDTAKERYKDWIKERMSLSIDPVFVNPDFIYIKVNSLVRYNVNATTLSATDIQSLVLAAISEYGTENLDDFNVTLRSSKLTKTIDDATPSIVSNDTTLSMYKLVQPTTNTVQSFNVNFLNAIKPSSITSSRFSYKGVSSVLSDDGKGTLRVINASSGAVLNANQGVINYTTGLIEVRSFEIETFSGSGLQFIVTAVEQDIKGLKNNILTIRTNDIVVTTRAERL